MLFIVEKVSRLRFGWNKRSLTEDDFHRICRGRRITVVEMPLRTNGFYYCVLGRHFIAIDTRLRPEKKLFVMFHELAHYFLHTPETGTTANFHGVGAKTRQEIEADAFALCALIPKTTLAQPDAAERLAADGFDDAVIRERFALFERHAI